MDNTTAEETKGMFTSSYENTDEDSPNSNEQFSHTDSSQNDADDGSPIGTENLNDDDSIFPEESKSDVTVLEEIIDDDTGSSDGSASEDDDVIEDMSGAENMEESSDSNADSLQKMIDIADEAHEENPKNIIDALQTINIVLMTEDDICEECSKNDVYSSIIATVTNREDVDDNIFNKNNVAVSSIEFSTEEISNAENKVSGLKNYERLNLFVENGKINIPKTADNLLSRKENTDHSYIILNSVERTLLDLSDFSFLYPEQSSEIITQVIEELSELKNTTIIINTGNSDVEDFVEYYDIFSDIHTMVH